jgi:hypothetical protein
MARQHDPTTLNVRLHHPTLKLALTPPREADEEVMVSGLNHPSVYMNLNGPPYPYTHQDWEQRHADISSAADQNIADLQVIGAEAESGEISRDWTQRKWLGSRRITMTIREIVDENAPYIEGNFIGELGVQREAFMHLGNSDEAREKRAANDKLEVGDPHIQWMVGCMYSTASI